MFQRGVLRSVKSETGKSPEWPSVKTIQSPGAKRRIGRLSYFHARPERDFPVSDFTDLRTSITTGYNHKISMNISLKLATDPETGQSSGLTSEGDSKISHLEFP